MVGLLALLFIARYCGVSKLQVLGDSEVIVKWFEGVQALFFFSLKKKRNFISAITNKITF